MKHYLQQCYVNHKTTKTTNIHINTSKSQNKQFQPFLLT